MAQQVHSSSAEIGHDLPAAVGIGLKPQHYAEILDAATGEAGATPALSKPAWLEVHPQNYFGVGVGEFGGEGGGPPHRWLSAIAENYPLSFHSVALSLGSADGLNEAELTQLAALCERYSPAAVSDHLSFSGNAHDRFSDLLPIPYTHEALDHFAKQIDRVQQRLGRIMLIENPSRYLAYADDNMDEVAFLSRLIRMTGCRLILDINNIVVSCANLDHDAAGYLDAISPEWVGEIHLAGHTVEQHDTGPLHIDDHGSPVGEETWHLFERFIIRAGPKPTLIEWDSDVPEYPVLMAEAAKAQAIIDKISSPRMAAHALAC